MSSSPATVLVLGRSHDDPGFATSGQIAEAISQHTEGRFELKWAYLQDLEILCDTESGVTIHHQGVDIATYGLIFLHGWFAQWKDEVYAVASYLSARQVPFLNSEAAHQRSSAKVSQAVLFGLNHLSIPKTFYSAHLGHNDEIRRRCEEAIGFPLILKQSDGNKGKNNFLVADSNELQRLLAEHPDVRFVAQQYIPNDGDVRIITYEETFLLAIGRSSDGDSHLHNVSLGATPTLLAQTDIDGQILADCFKAASLMHRELSGMDVMRSTDTGTWYILESNNMPQLMSGAFADEKARKLADVFAKKLSDAS